MLVVSLLMVVVLLMRHVFKLHLLFIQGPCRIGRQLLQVFQPSHICSIDSYTLVVTLTAVRYRLRAANRLVRKSEGMSSGRLSNLIGM